MLEGDQEMKNKTFKEINENASIEKRVVKSGLSLAIVFTKEDQKKFGIKYNSIIKLDNAEIGESEE